MSVAMVFTRDEADALRQHLARGWTEINPNLASAHGRLITAIDSAAPPDYDPPSESLSQSSLDSPKHSEPS